MKAAVYYGRGDIRIESVPEPSDPRPGEVVLEVTRAAICGTDSSEWAHGPMLTRPPVTLGHEFVGRVVSIGDEVTGLAQGDRVVRRCSVVRSLRMVPRGSNEPLLHVPDARVAAERRLGPACQDPRGCLSSGSGELL